MEAAVAAGIPLRPVVAVAIPLRRAAVAIANPPLPTVGEVAAEGTAGGESRCQAPGFRCQGARRLTPKGVHVAQYLGLFF